MTKSQAAAALKLRIEFKKWKGKNPQLKGRLYINGRFLTAKKTQEAKGMILRLDQAINSYNNIPNRVSGQQIKSALGVVGGQYERIKTAMRGSSRSPLRRSGDDLPMLKSSFDRGSVAFTRAVNAGHAKRDSMSFFKAVVDVVTNPAIVGGVGGLIVLPILAASSAAAAVSAGVSVSSGSGVAIAPSGTSALASNLSGLSVFSSAVEAEALIAGQALADAIGAGLTGTAAQTAAATAVTQAGVGALTNGALAAIQSLSVGTAAASGSIFSDIASKLSDVFSKEKARVFKQLEDAASIEGALKTVGGLAGSALIDRITPKRKILQPIRPVFTAEKEVNMQQYVEAAGDSQQGQKSGAALLVAAAMVAAAL